VLYGHGNLSEQIKHACYIWRHDSSGPQRYHRLFQTGFQVVQLAWGDASWEAGPPGSIKSGACRPATFFQYIYENFYSGGGSPVYSPTTNPTADFCLQGHSAGAGAIEYYLTYYGGAAYVDRAMFTSGPHFAEVD
jgi:hypothetical protein